MTISSSSLPTAFVWKRLHSFTGLWIVGFLIIHLFTNSQAALWIGGDGSSFVRSVDAIHDLPYLQAIEIALLGVPFFIHIVWGIQYLFTSKFNSFPSNGTTPSLPEYPRNHAYTWQRITSWILLVGIVAHVIQMRFLEYPHSVQKGSDTYYIVRVNDDPGLNSLSARLGFELYDGTQGQQQWDEVLKEHPLKLDQRLAMTKSFGLAELLMVRDTFKIPIMLVLYTVLVISSCFHAFNGLWTFLITWGVSLSVRSQRLTRVFSTILMFLIAFLGLAAIWGTYWINLKQ